jgi:hypothetical protein
MVRLSPGFWRVAASVDRFILIGIVLGYFSEGYLRGHWWTTGYLCSFSVALVVVPLLSWLIWVPRVLEYSEAEIRIATFFRDTRQPWKRLKSYGPSGAVFAFRFKGEFQGYQIMSQAYSKADWNRFTEYLDTRVPGRES